MPNGGLAAEVWRNVYQGALTVYNFNGDAESTIRASLTNITAGSHNAPVIGSGVFVSGFGDSDGWVELGNLSTGPVYSNGMLPYGTADIMTAGVFIVDGLRARRVALRTSGAVRLPSGSPLYQSSGLAEAAGAAPASKPAVETAGDALPSHTPP